MVRRPPASDNRVLSRFTVHRRTCRCTKVLSDLDDAGLPMFIGLTIMIAFVILVVDSLEKL